MAYIIGMIILILIVVFREEFRHDEQGYVQERVGQPMFTFIVAGLILFFCCKSVDCAHRYPPTCLFSHLLTDWCLCLRRENHRKFVDWQLGIRVGGHCHDTLPDCRDSLHSGCSS